VPDQPTTHKCRCKRWGLLIMTAARVGQGLTLVNVRCLEMFCACCCLDTCQGWWVRSGKGVCARLHCTPSAAGAGLLKDAALHMPYSVESQSNAVSSCCSGLAETRCLRCRAVPEQPLSCTARLAERC
jgi:hypothetical protein